MLGSDVGPYRLTERIGARGVLETYRGLGDAGEVRVDRIDPRVTAKRPDIERIAEAVQRASNLHHASLVDILALARAHDAYYLVRAHRPGRSLTALLDAVEATRAGRLPSWLALYITGELLTALSVIHGHDAAHGRLDATTVLVDDVGAVAVDGAFVLAALEPTLPVDAPEGVISRPADLFAVGTIFYRLLTGRRPFQAASYPVLRAQMQGTSRVAPSAFAPNTTPELDALVLAMIAPDPEQRPPSAIHALSVLMACADASVWTRTPEELRAALAAVPRPVSAPTAARRQSSFVGRALPAGAPSYQPVPLVPRQEVQWDPSTREFVHTFTPPRPSLPLTLEPDPLLLIARADGEIERALSHTDLLQRWRAPGPRPRLVAMSRTTWLEAGRFAALVGLEGLEEDAAPLAAVTHVGDLAKTSLLTLLAELGRARATGRLMVMDPAEPRTSRRIISLSEGAIVSVASNHPAHTTLDWLLRSGQAEAADLAGLFREVLRVEEPLIDLVAARRRLDPARLWAQMWTDRLAEPLCQRRGRYAFDASPLVGPQPLGGLDASAMLVEATRRAKTPEELRRWAAARRGTTYAVAQNFTPWTASLLLDERLDALSRELARHATLEDTIRRQPGDAGAIMMLAYLFHETRALVFR